MHAFASGFDARLLSIRDAGEIVRVCWQMQACVESVKALAAARAAEADTWQAAGYRSAADQLAHETGVSSASAKRTLETGRRMASQPEVAAAALAGELSLEQAAAVSDGVAANPSSAGELIDAARGASLSELNDKVAKVKAAACDMEARRRQIHSKRSLRRWRDRDGAFQAHMYGNPEDGAALWRMIDPIRRRLVVLRRQCGNDDRRNEGFDALDYDAMMILASLAVGDDAEIDIAELVALGMFPRLDAATLADREVPADSGAPPPALPPAAPPGVGAGPSSLPPTQAPDLFSQLEGPLARSALGGPEEAFPDHAAAPPPTQARRRRRRPKVALSPTRVIIRVDLDTLLRGYPIDGEICEMAGYGPIPVSVIEEAIATGSAFIIGALTKSQAVQGIYHHRRRANAHQRSALEFLYPTCAVKGCNASASLQNDHREDWSKTKFTLFDLLDRLCPHHHKLKTHHGWSLLEGTGKRRFVPPSDPHHPRHKMRPGRPAGPTANGHSESDATDQTPKWRAEDVE